MNKSCMTAGPGFQIRVSFFSNITYVVGTQKNRLSKHMFEMMDKEK